MIVIPSIPALVATLVIGAPNWVIPAIGTTCLITVVVLWSYVRAPTAGWIRITASTLKILAVLALAICLLEPLFSGTRPRPGANAFAVVVDNSESMNVRARETKQLQSTLKSDSEWQSRLAQDFDLRSYVFDRQVRNVEDFNSLTFDGAASSLAAAVGTVTERLRRRPTAGLLLFTDGNGTDDWDPDQLEGLSGIPVFPVLQQVSDESRDLRVTKLNVSQTNFEAAPTTIEVAVAVEEFVGEKIVGQLVDSEGDVAHEQVRTVADDESSIQFRFRFRPEKSGLNFFRFHTFVDSERRSFEKGITNTELTLRNNTRWIVVDRGGGPFRVLYVAGRPNWEFKFLRRALDGDEEVKLTGLLRIARKEPKFAFRDKSGLGDQNRLFDGFENTDDEDVEGYDQPVLIRLGIDSEEELRDGFPKSPEELFVYDAIIIDDLEAKFFSPDQMTLIRRFVTERGGGLLMSGGQESFVEGAYDKTPIGELLPVYVTKSEDFDESFESSDERRWTLTREGMLQPWARTRATEIAELNAQSEMPAFVTLNRISDVKPGAQTVAKLTSGLEAEQPALVTQRFGKGRSAALMVGDMWRWSLRREKTEADDLAQLWRQVTRWLVSDVPRRVDVILSPFVPGKPIHIEVHARDEEFRSLDNANVSLTIVTPDKDELTLDALATDRSGIYVGEYWPKVDGCYQVVAQVTTEDGTLVGTRTTGWAAEPAAAEFETLVPNRNRLKQIAKSTGGEVIDIDNLEGFVKSLPNRKIPIKEPWVYPLWHHPLVFGFAIVCLCGEWGLRRWRGLA